MKTPCLTLLAFGLAFACVPFSRPAIADEPEGSSASLRVFEYAAWTLVPVLRGGPPNSVVAGFYAFPSEVSVEPGNIARLWFEQDEPGTWTARAVDPADFGAFTAYLDSIGVNAGLVEEWEASLVFEGMPAEPAPAGELIGGLLEGDPLLPLLESGANMGDFIDLYGLLGQPVAPIVSIALAEGAAQGAGNGQPLSPAIAGEVGDTLNCIASMAAGSEPGIGGINECAWCTCTTTYGPFTPTPPGTWPPPVITTVGSRTKCEYRRDGTVTFTKTGQKWYCPSCAATGTTSAHEYGAEDVLSTDPCPVAPSNPTVVVP